MTEVPGATAAHAIISDDCRSNHGSAGAFDEAVQRLSEAYLSVVDGWKIGSGAKIHVVLTVERPQSDRVD